METENSYLINNKLEKKTAQLHHKTKKQPTIFPIDIY